MAHRGNTAGWCACGSGSSKAPAAPLDVLIVRKVGSPGNPELALAAVTGPGQGGLVVNEQLQRLLYLTDGEVESLAAAQVDEIAHLRALWRAASPLPFAGRAVLVVDDGVATGTTLRAAIRSVLQQGARQVGVAVPLALGASLRTLPKDVDPVICPHPAAPFSAVGMGYEDFPQVTDQAVARILEQAGARQNYPN